ncbi:MAG: hypothetical protein WC951_10570 [Bacteroidales bacterium]|nr:hypothetical protein [Tenuifilaceae bacterium]
MEYSALRKYVQAITKQKTRFKTRLAIFGFFCVVASILWYLNKLTYEYTSEITFPLKVQNMPSGKVLVGDPPKQIPLQIRGYGYILLRYRLGASLSPIYVDLEQAPLMPFKNSDTKYFLLTSTLRNIISNQLQSNLQLGSVGIDTLHFEFAKMVQKKVEVKLDLAYTLERQHILANPIILLPDSIVISGPRTLIDTITSIYTKPLKLDKLSSTYTTMVPVNEIKQVGLSHRRVSVTIPVEKYTEANISKTIEIRNLPDSLKLILLPKMASIKCNVLVSRYRELIEGGGVTLYVNYDALNIRENSKLEVQVEAKTYSVKVIEVSPKYVDYLIEKIQ